MTSPSPTNAVSRRFFRASTPSLILDAETGLLSNYYYQRDKGGVLRRRVVMPNQVFSNSLNWPISEAVAIGSEIAFDAGNVNTAVIKGMHYLSFYSVKAPETTVLVSELPAPTIENPPPSPAHSGWKKE